MTDEPSGDPPDDGSHDTDESLGVGNYKPDGDGDDWGRIPIRIDRETDSTRGEPRDVSRLEPDSDAVTHRSPDDEAEPDEFDPYAPEPSSTPIEPGTPSLENAVFVLLGALAMALVMFRLASILIV